MGVCALAAAGAVLHGQPPADPNATVEPALLKALRYRMIGPHKGSRVTAVAGVPTEPLVYYMGAAGGGIWKTMDAGENWDNVSDGFFRSGSIGAIAVAPSQPEIVYAGTGSACIRGNTSAGDGMYKSTDAGRTWTHVGIADAGQIGRVLVHPTNPSLVYVAALGHAFGPNEERGVFRSKDGGQSWQKVLLVSSRTGAVDMAWAPSNPSVLYAAMWTGERKPWTMLSGSEEGGLFKSTNGGDDWRKLGGGLPTGIVGRIGVTVSPKEPNRVWALVEAHEGGIYRSDDAGATFTRINSDEAFQTRPWYYMHIWADPLDPNTVYVGDTNFYISRDGGVTFSSIPMPHGDNHDLWINPTNPLNMIEGNDGGASVTFNGGSSWSTQLNQPTAEMYRVSVDNGFPYRVYGSQQDTYVVLSVPSRSVNFGAKLQLQFWEGVGGMEGGDAAVDPRNPNIVYAGGTGGDIYRYDRRTGVMRPIKAYPAVGNMPARHLRYRFQRTAPIFLSPHNPDALYHASNVVHRSLDGGQTWSVISPDLTRNDPAKLGTFGGPITREVTSEEVYCTIFALEESPIRAGVLWSGSDDGLVHVSRDNGRTWQNVTPNQMPEWGTVNAIDPSPHDAGRALVTVLRHRLDDFRPYVFGTADYGKTWRLLTDGRNGIPSSTFVRVVREDPDRKGLLYAGTEQGAYVSFDDGAHWQSLQLNLPVVPITDLVVHQKDLVLSTQGRSFWILDDVSPLHQITDRVTQAGAFVFAPRAAHRVRTSEQEANQPYVGGRDKVANLRDLYGGARIERRRIGHEIPEGAFVYTYFSAREPEEAVLEILDASGAIVRRFSTRDDPKDLSVRAKPEPPWFKPESTFAQPGLNRFVWDLRYPGPEVADGIRLSRYASLGPLAKPGKYQVRVRAGDWSQTQPLEIVKDPRIDASPEHLSEQFDLQMRIRDLITDTQRMVVQVRTARGHLSSSQESGSRAAAPLAGNWLAQLSAIERELVDGPEDRNTPALDYAPSLHRQLTYLYNFVGSVDARPTASAVARHDELERQVREQQARLEQLLSAACPAGACGPGNLR